MSTLKVNKIESKGSGGDAQHLELSTNGSTQMYITSADEPDTTTATTLTNSALSAAITPSSTSSKIFVNASVTAGSNSDENNVPGFGLRRDSTDIGLSTTASGNRKNVITGPGQTSNAFLGNCTMSHLDSPNTTSEVIYYMTFLARSGYTTQINKTGSDSDNAYVYRGSSTITLMEISG